MFCDEVITKVYMGIADDPAIPAPEMFLDCFYEMAYHCTEGYRIVLETDHYAISLSSIGVTKESRQNPRERDNEWLRSGLEYMEEFENEHRGWTSKQPCLLESGYGLWRTQRMVFLSNLMTLN